jgi:hypothetical protein
VLQIRKYKVWETHRSRLVLSHKIIVIGVTPSIDHWHVLDGILQYGIVHVSTVKLFCSKGSYLHSAVMVVNV